MTVQTPSHLAAFNKERNHRIAATNRVAGTTLAQAKAEAAQIIERAEASAAAIVADGQRQAVAKVREADAESKRIIRAANNTANNNMAKASSDRNAAAKIVATARERARTIRQEGFAKKREIILAAKNCTADVAALYEAADADCKRITRTMTLRTYKECQDMRMAAERDAKLIREKARNEGLAMADLEIQARATKEISSAQYRGNRRG